MLSAPELLILMVLLTGLFFVGIYLAVRLGVRHGRRDSSDV